MPLAAQIAKLLTKGAQDLMSSPTGAIMKHSPTLRELTPEQEAASYAPVRTSSYTTPEPIVADTPPTTPIDTPEINEVPPVRTEMDDFMSPAGGKGKGGEGTNWEDTAPLEEIEKFYKLPENQRQAQTPQLKEASQALLKGDIDKQDFDEIADTFYPSKSITEMPEPPHVRRIEAVLGKKVKSRPVVDETISKDLEGERVGTRLDIPAYNTYDTWVVTIHGPGKGGKALHYSKTAYLKNVTFMSDESKALKVATEDTSKNSFARMEGDWKDIKPDAAYALAEAELNKPNSEWVQIGMNPYKHSYFYDKKTMQPILSAGEVIQVGPLVLARNVVRGKSSDFTFNKGGVVDMRNGGVVGMVQGGPLPPVPRSRPSYPIPDGLPLVPKMNPLRTEQRAIKEIVMASTLKEIADAEGTEDQGYNIVFGTPRGGSSSRFINPTDANNKTMKLTSMTLKELDTFQRKLINATRDKVKGVQPGYGTSAVGKYQVTRPTLELARTKLGYSRKEWNKLKYTPELQEQIGRVLLEHRGIDKMLEGKTTPKKFRINLSNEWASIPGKTKKVGGQPTPANVGRIEGAFRKAVNELKVSRDSFIN